MKILCQWSSPLCSAAPEVCALALKSVYNSELTLIAAVEDLLLPLYQT
jgi:hypothetical protein